MKKLLLTVSLAAVLICGAMFAACGSGNGGEEVYEGASETFTGVVSDQSYSDEDAAAEAFVANELSGQNAATYISCENKGDLAEDKISELNLEGALGEGDTVKGVKIMSVKFSVNSAASKVTLAAEQNVQEFVIYVIIVTPAGVTIDEYYYYVPISERGDVLTKSYFEDVLNLSKYANFTQTYKQETKVHVSAMGVEQSQDSATNYQIQVDGSKGRIHMEGDLVQSATQGNVINGYFEEKDGQFKSYMSLDDGEEQWTSFVFDGVTSMQGIVEMCLPDYDFSFYEKTGYGFKLNEDFLSRLYAEMFDSILNSYQSMGISADDIKINVAELKFYVVEGRLDKMVSNISLSLNMNMSYEGQSVSMSVSASNSEELVFSDFGSTTVTTPAALQAQA